MGRFRNEVIRERVGWKSVLDYIQRQQAKWLGHLDNSTQDMYRRK